MCKDTVATLDTQTPELGNGEPPWYISLNTCKNMLPKHLYTK